MFVEDSFQGVHLQVPAHFRSNWASYQVEAIVLLLLAVYMVNYVLGRSRNQAIAYSWFNDVANLLQQQFTLVGDDGTSEEPTEGHLVKETDANYSIWLVLFSYFLRKLLNAVRSLFPIMNEFADLMNFISVIRDV